MSNTFTIAIVHENGSLPVDIVRTLGPGYRLLSLSAHKVRDMERIPAHLVIVDVSGFSSAGLAEFAERLLMQRQQDQPIVLIVTRTSHAQIARLGLLSGNNAIQRPLAENRFSELVSSLLAVRNIVKQNVASAAERTVASHNDPVAQRLHQATSALIRALDLAFAIGENNAPVTQQALHSEFESITSEIKADGLRSWMDTVRAHHQSTYQHCLLVAGTAVAMSDKFGFSKGDTTRVLTAAVLHDLGKAKIPLSVLDKLGRLTPDENQLMRTHPSVGHAMLMSADGFDPEMLHMVLSHHEALDGTGYPNGLRGSEISDLVRVITIADVYAALIEKRSYKPPLSCETAFQILLSMDKKIDVPLVKAQRDVLLAA